MIGNEKKANSFKNKCYSQIVKLGLLIDTLPDKGDTCSKSQKICLRIALANFERAVNGVENTDFEDEK